MHKHTHTHTFSDLVELSRMVYNTKGLRGWDQKSVFAAILYPFYRERQKDARKHRMVFWQFNASSDWGSIWHRSTVQRQLAMDTDTTIHPFSLSLLSSWGTKWESIFRLVVVFSSLSARESRVSAVLLARVSRLGTWDLISWRSALKAWTAVIGLYQPPFKYSCFCAVF